jgi:hypothetical protein
MNKNLKKRQSMILGIIVAFVMISVGLFAGCTSNNTTISDQPFFFSENNTMSLDAAYTDYASLRENVPAYLAREQLINKLQNETEVVKTAKLGVDNYSIFIEYVDGGFAVVDTFEYGEFSNQTNETKLMFDAGYSNNEYRTDDLPSQATGFGYSYGVEEPLQPTYQVSFDTIDLSHKKMNPTTKKILILGPAYYEFSKQPWDDTVSFFKSYGWTDDDIVIKNVYKDATSKQIHYGNIQPEDYFNLSEYGIIFFNGHGCAYTDFNERYMYLQFCYFSDQLMKEDSELNNKLKELNENHKIIISSKAINDSIDPSIKWYSTGIQGSYLREMMSTLPSSYVYLSTCYSSILDNIFLDRGAKIFLGYTSPVDSKVSDANMLALNTLLLEKNCNVNRAFLDESIKISSYGYITTKSGEKQVVTTYLSLSPSTSMNLTAYYFYFPAWLQLTVTSIPSGTSYITSSLYDSSSTLIGEAQDRVNPSDIQIECEHLKNLMAPSTEEVTVKIKAYNSGGQEFASGEKTVTLVAGGNPIQIALAESGGLTIEFTNQKNGQLDVHRSLNELWSLDLKAKLQNTPNGDILYIWDNLGDSSLGGFGMNMVQHLETDDPQHSFYSSGNGTDGQKIPITCTAYLVKENGGRELLASGSAEIEVYHPTQIYEICGPDSTKAPKFGSDSTWDFIHVDHRMLYGNQFYARKGDQLQVMCSHAGTMYEGFDYDIYIRVGKTSDPPAATQLIVSESEIVDGLNKIVTIDI